MRIVPWDEGEPAVVFLLTPWRVDPTRIRRQ
jgi:hypothetical protein